MKNEVKVGLTGLDWALSIGGIILLLCVIILPPVFRATFKDDKKEEDVPKVVIEHLTCKKLNYMSEGAMNDSVYEFTYLNDHIRTYSIKKTMSYQALDTYDAAKQSFGRLNTAYSLLDGLEYIVTPDEKNLKLSVTESYNLGTFKSTTITIPGDETEIKVNSVYDTQDSVKEIKHDLESEGYTCK